MLSGKLKALKKRKNPKLLFNERTFWIIFLSMNKKCMVIFFFQIWKMNEKYLCMTDAWLYNKNAEKFTQILIILFDLDIRLVEEVKEKCNGVSLQNEDVYMNAGFEDFASCVIRRFRGIEDKEPFTYDAVSSLTHDHKIKWDFRLTKKKKFS